MSKSLLRIKDLKNDEINEIIVTAQKFKDHKITKSFSNKIVANLFFESSTRTHYSFITAEYRLGCKPIDFQTSTSSINKGETFHDTVKTFTSFGVDAIVIRSVQNAWYHDLKNIKIPLINAGDGTLDHPTQTLLDLMTIKQEFGKFKGLKVLIVGDIKHSRVAHSNIEVMRRLGMEVMIAAPKEFQDHEYQYTDFDQAVRSADVINLLRIQNERLTDKMQMTISEYNAQYGLNARRVQTMKSKAIIIHPAPFNRNVEINDDIVECSRSRIFKQMENGVYIRMAVIARAFK